MQFAVKYEFNSMCTIINTAEEEKVGRYVFKYKYESKKKNKAGVELVLCCAMKRKEI